MVRTTIIVYKHRDVYFSLFYVTVYLISTRTYYIVSVRLFFFVCVFREMLLEVTVIDRVKILVSV